MSTLDLGSSSIPTRTAPGIIALARESIAAYNAQPLAGQGDNVAFVHAAALALQSAIIRSGLPAPAAFKATTDLRMDRLWSASSSRLKAWLSLADEPEHKADAARAEVIWDAVFADGLAWLRGMPADQWVIADTKLKLIDDTAYAADFARLVGPEFDAALRRRHAEYGEVMGITKVAPAPSDAGGGIADALKTLRESLQDYVRGILGTVRRRDPASLARAEALLLPLTRRRAEEAARAAHAKKQGEASDAETTEPVEAPIPAPTTQA